VCCSLFRFSILASFSEQADRRGVIVGRLTDCANVLQLCGSEAFVLGTSRVARHYWVLGIGAPSSYPPPIFSYLIENKALVET